MILYGTSCSGKSTLIRKLCSDHGFIPINGYVTRELREDDFARIRLPMNEFQAKMDNGYFLIVNKYLSVLYGNARDEFDLALQDKDNTYILDYLIKDHEKLSAFKYSRVIIVPENEQQLIEQIKSSGRHDRTQSILSDCRENYNGGNLSAYRAHGFSVIVNKFGNLNAAINGILEIEKNTRRK